MHVLTVMHVDRSLEMILKMSSTCILYSPSQRIGLRSQHIFATINYYNVMIHCIIHAFYNMPAEDTSSLSSAFRLALAEMKIHNNY